MRIYPLTFLSAAGPLAMRTFNQIKQELSTAPFIIIFLGDPDQLDSLYRYLNVIIACVHPLWALVACAGGDQLHQVVLVIISQIG